MKNQLLIEITDLELIFVLLDTFIRRKKKINRVFTPNLPSVKIIRWIKHYLAIEQSALKESIIIHDTSDKSLQRVNKKIVLTPLLKVTSHSQFIFATHHFIQSHSTLINFNLLIDSNIERFESRLIQKLSDFTSDFTSFTRMKIREPTPVTMKMRTKFKQDPASNTRM